MGLTVFVAVFFMIGLSFASVPLYNLFCKVTGYGGTTQIASELPERISDRVLTVRFNADTSPNLPWHFKPETNLIEVNPGKRVLVSYNAQNKWKVPVAGTAVYNVSPPKAGKYFHKIECFCFADQILTPSERINMPVVFFIDPAIDEDPNMNDVTTITLSYSFFKTDSTELDNALEAFYNQDELAASGLAGDG